MRVDTLKKWTDSGVTLSRFRKQFLLLRHSRPQCTLELWETDSLARMAKEHKVVENATIKHSMHGNTQNTSANFFHSDETCPKRGKFGRSFGKCVLICYPNNPNVTASRARVAKVRVFPKRDGIVVKVDTCHHNAQRTKRTQWMSRQRQ